MVAFRMIFAGICETGYLDNTRHPGGLASCILIFLSARAQWCHSIQPSPFAVLLAEVLTLQPKTNNPFALGIMFMAIAWQGRTQHDTPADLGVSLGLSGFIFMLAGFSLLAVHPVEGILAVCGIEAFGVLAHVDECIVYTLSCNNQLGLAKLFPVGHVAACVGGGCSGAGGRARVILRSVSRQEDGARPDCGSARRRECMSGAYGVWRG